MTHDKTLTLISEAVSSYVAGEISSQEFADALRRHAERIAPALRGNPKPLRSPEDNLPKGEHIG